MVPRAATASRRRRVFPASYSPSFDGLERYRTFDISALTLTGDREPGYHLKTATVIPQP